MADSLLDNYNPLYDIHLRQYFALPHMQKHLQKMGLLESTLNLNGEEVYARHHAMMDMMLKNREAQLMRMAELRKKLDAAEKVEICRRIRSGQSPESYRRGKPSRSLSRSRAAQKGGRQRRFSNSFEDKDFVQNIEKDNAEPIDYNPNDPYKRLSANAKRFNYLHKLDDPTLIAYKDNLKKQLQRLERFREISFGPHSVARQPAPPQTSWFFRRRSLPSLTASAPGNTLKDPIRSILSMRGRKTAPHSGGSKLNASHDSRTSCPPTTRKRRDSNPRLPPINGAKLKPSKPPMPSSSAVARLPPTGKKESPSRGRPVTKRVTTTTTTTSSTTTKPSAAPQKTVLPSVTGTAILGGGAAAAAAAAAAALSVNHLISDQPSSPSPPAEPIHAQKTPTPPSSPVLEAQKTFDRSSPTANLEEYEQPESPTLQNRKATPAASPTLLDETHGMESVENAEVEDFGSHTNEAFSDNLGDRDEKKSNASEETEPNDDVAERIEITNDYENRHDSVSDSASESEPEYAEEDKEVEETFTKQDVHVQNQEPEHFDNAAVLEKDDHHEYHHEVDESTVYHHQNQNHEAREIPELTVDYYQSKEPSPRDPLEDSVEDHIVHKREADDQEHDETNLIDNSVSNESTGNIHESADHHSQPSSPVQEINVDVQEHEVQHQDQPQSPAQSEKSHSESAKEEHVEKPASPAVSEKSQPPHDLPSPAQSDRSQNHSVPSSRHSNADPSSPVPTNRSLTHEIANDLVGEVIQAQQLGSPVASEKSHSENLAGETQVELSSPTSPAQSQIEMTELPSPAQSEKDQNEHGSLETSFKVSPPASPVQNQHVQQEVADLPSPAQSEKSQHEHSAVETKLEASPPASPAQNHQDQEEIVNLPSPAQSETIHLENSAAEVKSEASPMTSPAGSENNHKETSDLPSPAQSEKSVEEMGVATSPPASPVQSHQNSEEVANLPSPAQSEKSQSEQINSSAAVEHSDHHDEYGNNREYIEQITVPQNMPSPTPSQESIQSQENHADDESTFAHDHSSPAHSHHSPTQEDLIFEEHFLRRVAQNNFRELPDPVVVENQEVNNPPPPPQVPLPVYVPRPSINDSWPNDPFVKLAFARPVSSSLSQAGESSLPALEANIEEAAHREQVLEHQHQNEPEHDTHGLEQAISEQAGNEATALIEEALSEAPAIIGMVQSYTENYVSPRQTNQQQQSPLPEDYELKYDHSQDTGHLESNNVMMTSIYQPASDEEHDKSASEDGMDHQNNGNLLETIESDEVDKHENGHENYQNDNVSTDSLIIHEEPSDYQMTQLPVKPREHTETKEWDEGNAHVQETTKNAEFTDEHGTHHVQSTTITTIKSGHNGEDDLANNNDDEDAQKSGNEHFVGESTTDNGNSFHETITRTSHTITSSSGLPSSGIIVDDEEEGNISSL